MNYPLLNIKTEYSLMTSLITIKDLVKYCVLNNIKQIALTDTNNINGCMEFYTECMKNNIKPIIGMELILNNISIFLYAKNNEGYKNLCKIETFYNKNEVNIENLHEFSNDLICICLFKHRKIYKKLMTIFDEIYIGYENEEENYNIKSDKKLCMISINALNSEDVKYIPYLDLIKRLKSEIEYENTYDINYVKSMTIDDDTIKTQQYIFDKCNVILSSDKLLLPIYETKNNDNYEYFKNLCIMGLKKRLNTNNIPSIYIDRLNYELDVIKTKNYINYFLIVFDYVRYAKTHDIMVGVGRGSAASSLVSYSVGITNVDPIVYDLLFERFLNPERITFPDIDIDFQFDKREEVINYCKHKYGEYNVSKIVTYSTLKSKQVLRDIGRILDIPVKVLDRLTNTIKTNDNLVTLYKTNEAFKSIIDEVPKNKRMLKIAVKLENLKKSKSEHAAGILICSDEMYNHVPLICDNDTYICGYDMNNIEDLGLIKMDFLGLKTLTIIKNIISDIKKYQKVDIDFDNIPLDNNKTFELFKSGDLLGIFQFESKGMMHFLRKLKPDNFNDIINAVALYRPGPMDNIDTFIRRKEKKEKIEVFDDRLRFILEPTNGILIYDEQMMQILRTMANYTFGEADILRRAMSKKKIDTIKKEEEKFIKESVKNGYSEKLSKTIYDMILQYSSYGFNKAHSTAYSIISYKMAYLKANYKDIFIINMLNTNISSIDTSLMYLNECVNNNISVCNPNINISDTLYVLDNNKIILPLIMINKINTNIANIIIEEKNNGIYDNFMNFVLRTIKKGLNKEHYIALIKAKCFDENIKTLLHNLDNIINYANLSNELGGDFVLPPNIIDKDLDTYDELCEYEIEVYDTYIFSDPLKNYKTDIMISSNDIKLNTDKIVELVGVINYVNEITTKKGTKMCFLKCSDKNNIFEVTVFNDLYMLLEDKKLDKKDVIHVKGKVQFRNEQHNVLATEIILLKKGE